MAYIAVLLKVQFTPIAPYWECFDNWGQTLVVHSILSAAKKDYLRNGKGAIGPMLKLQGQKC